ncbi:DUF3450 domain-containing protein [Enterovibrio sp. ZSDZ42]|uniref:DUF3450 domain-containing protein n=1 Tax=Enterovibrio gelatinilyticus TaxID=2899819 RepID=A0ABT5R2J6_9GAMM|nr:DUF3450 domain-containing protein [Enterovibrio sp. ZSDZ42]MDD1794494.1 DUF3450 domain-containing protein [Enterovibrio sp. ZSDZ42]
MKFITQAIVIPLISLSLPVVANTLDTAAAIEATTLQSAVASQQRIDVSDERAQKMKAEIALLQQDVENLSVYRTHLQNVVRDQGLEEKNLNRQLEDINHTRQGIVPLMYMMIDGLESWVETDLPIKAAHRQKRVDTLKSLMSKSDVSDAEKFRRILEAYQIELDYGSKLGSYQETVVLDGVPRDVDILHLGRISLIARRLDGEAFWFFNKDESRWQPVISSDLESLELAYQVADKKIAPTLLTLPLSVSSLQEEQK